MFRRAPRHNGKAGGHSLHTANCARSFSTEVVPKKHQPLLLEGTGNVHLIFRPESALRVVSQSVTQVRLGKGPPGLGK